MTSSFILQGSLREETAQERASIGYTVSKKVGKAVLRNKVKRRFREAVRIVFENVSFRGCDYVLIARRGSDQVSFQDLVKELSWALKHLHRLLESTKR